jgi:cell shape-determining protein MreC
MKENGPSLQRNREIIDSILVKLECFLFIKHSGVEIPEEELDALISMVKKLAEYDDEYKTMQEETKILWLKIQQLEEDNEELRKKMAT